MVVVVVVVVVARGAEVVGAEAEARDGNSGRTESRISAPST